MLVKKAKQKTRAGSETVETYSQRLVTARVWYHQHTVRFFQRPRMGHIGFVLAS